jgi:voltage-gated potassium channel
MSNHSQDRTLDTLRRRVWQLVEPDPRGDWVSRWFDLAIITLILLNVTAVILASVASVQARWGAWLAAFELFSVAVFSVEYGLRLWAVTAEPHYARPVAGRLRFALRPLPLIDLLAILPYYLAPLAGADLRVIRVLRLMRLLRILKLGRYLRAFRMIGQVLRHSREELLLTLGMLLILLIIASALMYHAEHAAQPEQFPDIPATMWWAIVTLTTVGYGDIYPVTTVGKLVAAVIAIFGIGMVALPAGIIGSGFVEEIHRQRHARPDRCCPRCGEPLAPESPADPSPAEPPSSRQERGPD